MIKFSDFLVEQAEAEPEAKKLKHLPHVEDMSFSGHEGVGIAAQHLEDTHNLLLGKRSQSHISTKYDGAPSIVFGIHPETKKFFVATKSAFNAEPKINYTSEDIEKNHGHSPGLAAKLKDALTHLPKIMPRNGGVYQGDLMYSDSDVKKTGKKLSFTPNTITYSADASSPQGARIRNSKLGVVVHTKYTGRNFNNLSATILDNKQRNQFQDHPDVNNIDPTVHVDPHQYSHEDQREFLNHLENAKRTYGKMAPEAMDVLRRHQDHLEQYINSTVRSGDKPTVEGFSKLVSDKSQKDIDKVKTQATKDRYLRQHADAIKDINDNSKHIKAALELHGHLQNAKNVLARVLSKNNDFEHSIGDEQTGPEGHVVWDKNDNATKIVDRAEFSRQNFLRGKMQQLKKAQNA
jgi:hypothetical protein